MNKAAQALGRLAKGIPKKYSPEELDRRRRWAAELRARKAAKRLAENKSK